MPKFIYVALLLCVTTILAWKHETCSEIDIRCGETSLEDKNYITFPLSFYEKATSSGERQEDLFTCGRKVVINGANYFIVKAGPAEGMACGTSGLAMAYVSDRPCFDCDDFAARSATCPHARIVRAQNGDEFCLKEVGEPSVPKQGRGSADLGMSGKVGEPKLDRRRDGEPQDPEIAKPTPAPTPAPPPVSVDSKLAPSPAEGGSKHGTCPAGTGGGRRLAGERKLAKVAVAKIGQKLLKMGLEAAVGFGTNELLDMWFDPSESVHSANARCTDVCRPYPNPQLAEFCGSTVHSHRIHCSISGRDIKIRDQFAYIMWEKMLIDRTFKDFAESVPICKASFIDLLCLDAFPHCHCDDRTACEISCRNMNLCLAERDKNLIDCQQACTVEGCTVDTTKMCKIAAADHTISSGRLSTLVLAVVAMSLATHLKMGI